MTNQVNDNWYEDFFQGINCELWENAIPAEATKRDAFKHYVFTLGEVKRLLESVGLSIVSTYSSIAKDAYKLGDPQVYIVAQKD